MLDHHEKLEKAFGAVCPGPTKRRSSHRDLEVWIGATPDRCRALSAFVINSGNTTILPPLSVSVTMFERAAASGALINASFHAIGQDHRQVSKITAARTGRRDAQSEVIVIRVDGKGGYYRPRRIG